MSEDRFLAGVRALRPRLPNLRPTSQQTSTLVLAAVALTATAIAALVWIFMVLAPEEGMADHLRNAVTAVGALGLAATAALAYRRQRLGEAQHHALLTQNEVMEARDRRDHREATERDLRERFTTAAAQIGDSAMPVRFAGVYAMSALADTWLDRDDFGSSLDYRGHVRSQAQICIDVLCGYLRSSPAPPHSLSVDREVRSSIVRIISSKVRRVPTGGDSSHGAGGAASGPWSWARFDLAGSEFDFVVDFGQARFDGGLDCSGAVFREDVSFVGAQFKESEACFIGAVFDGGVTAFDEAVFEGGCSFARSRFTSPSTRFYSVSCKGSADFRDCDFAGYHTSFASVVFETLQTVFNGSRFSGEKADWNGAVLGNHMSDFGEVRFESHHTLFIGTRFVGELAPIFTSGIAAEGVVVEDVRWAARPKPRSGFVAFDPRIPDVIDVGGIFTYSGIGLPMRPDGA